MYKVFTCPFLSASSVVPPYAVFPQLVFFLVVVDLLVKLKKLKIRAWCMQYDICSIGSEH